MWRRSETMATRAPTHPLTADVKRRIITWIRGASLGMIGYAAMVLLSVGCWDWLWGQAGCQTGSNYRPRFPGSDDHQDDS